MLSMESIKNMDLETAMMAVQSNRANLLETQLKDQIATMQAKNDKISKLNTMMGLLNAASAKFSANANASTSLHTEKGAPYVDRGEYEQAFAAAGFEIKDLMPSGKNDDGIFGGNDINRATKSDITGAIEKLKSNIDSLSNNQQMDMLRLQSLSNKRNEAFDLMSNFIKKMQDSRSSILANMR